MAKSSDNVGLPFAKYYLKCQLSFIVIVKLIQINVRADSKILQKEKALELLSGP